MTHLTPRQRALYDHLLELAREGAPAPTLEALCAQLGLRSRGSLHKHVRALVAAGLVEPLDRHRGGVRLSTPEEAGLPLLGRIAAGRPIEALADAGRIEVPPLLRRPRPCYVLEVRGDSMSDAGILDGDYVVIEPRPQARNGEVVVALVRGSEATLKRIEQAPGRVTLHPANPAHAPMHFAPDEVQIQGVLVGQFRVYR